MCNPFPVNVPIIEKPGSLFLLAKCVKKNLWKSFSVSGTLAWHGLITLIALLLMTLLEIHAVLFSSLCLDVGCRKQIRK